MSIRPFFTVSDFGSKIKKFLRMSPFFMKKHSVLCNQSLANSDFGSSRLSCSSRIKNKVCDSRETTSFIEAFKFTQYPAIYDSFGLHKYGELLTKAALLANKLNNNLNSEHKNELKLSRKRLFCCLLCPNDSRYVYSLWGAWLNGHVAVPLSGKHPEHMLGYFVDDCQADVLLYTQEYEDVAKKLLQSRPKLEIHLVDHGDKHCETDSKSYEEKWTEIQKLGGLVDEPALVIYTSGTTGYPKGVVHTHGTINAMVQGMLKAWEWSPKDAIVHTLPLNHVHGIVNALLTPLTCGALSIMLPKFEPSEVWKLLLEPDRCIPRRPSIFMGVPTTYSLLMNFLEQNSQNCSSALNASVNRSSNESQKIKLRDDIKEACLKNIRLFVSGSAPLPIPTMDAWEELTGHKLLERYGMTELGMVLTNPLHGPRIPRAVGLPFPYVEVAIGQKNNDDGYDILVKSDENDTQVFTENDGGELLVRGGTVFKEYLNKPEATKAAFTGDGWFVTGDTAVYDDDVQTYKILGRTSVDVIKSGGYKLSALEIENQMARHPFVQEVAVLGLPDHLWGQKVVALVVLKKNFKWEGGDVNGSILDWCRKYMASYQVPKTVKVVENLKRNAMGKLNKKELQRQHFEQEIE